VAAFKPVSEVKKDMVQNSVCIFCVYFSKRFV